MEKKQGNRYMKENMTVPIRLNKYLSDAGVCSRRQADRMVEEGRVFIDDEKALMGQKVLPGQQVYLDGQRVYVSRKRILLAVNKPKGIVCTTQKKDKNNIVDFIGYPERIYPVGRLDKESEGLILMTNDGELMNEILRARNYHEKEYEVRVDKPVKENFIRKMEQGVPILDTVTRPCTVKKTGLYSFQIILTQGLNRQIRRMCEALGYQVKELRRLRIMNITLGELPQGSYREVTKKEFSELEHLIHRSKQTGKYQGGDFCGKAGTNQRTGFKVK